MSDVKHMELDEIKLLGYVDGLLEPSDRDAVERAIRSSPGAARRVALLRASRLPYATAFASVSAIPVPKSLADDVEKMVRLAQMAEISQTSGFDASPLRRELLQKAEKRIQSRPFRQRRNALSGSRHRSLAIRLGLILLVGICSTDYMIKIIPESTQLAPSKATVAVASHAPHWAVTAAHSEPEHSEWYLLQEKRSALGTVSLFAAGASLPAKPFDASGVVMARMASTAGYPDEDGRGAPP